MKYDVLRQAAEYSRARKRKKRWFGLVTCLAAVVVFCTTYALILPALTKERALFCGHDEHTHTKACQQASEQELLCVYKPHIHTDDCIGAEGENLCGYADFVIHSHDRICFDAEDRLICQLPEIESHTHVLSCYAVSEVDEIGDTELVCEIYESVIHRHDEDCYAPVSADRFDVEDLVCETPVAALHQHDEICRDDIGNIACGHIDISEHIHSEDCFTAAHTKAIFTCGVEQHQHDDDCYIDKNADVETAAVWEATLPKELTGKWNVDITAIAKSQLGYQESAINAVIGTDGTARGYTRYGAWYGDPYGDWSAMFIAFCLNYAGVEHGYFPYETDHRKSIEALTEAELYADSQGYTPKTGDLVFFRNEDKEASDRVGLVVELITDADKGSARVKILEGDSDDRVQCIEYPMNDESILGYGKLGEAYDTFEKYAPRQKLYVGEAVTVKATYFSSAEIPDDAELVVKELGLNTDTREYENRYQEALEAIESANGQSNTTEITDFRLYDISFIYLDEEIQPLDSVDIQISFPAAQMTEAAEISVVHYTHEGAQLPEVQEYDLDKSGNLSVGVETDSFSLFAVVTSQSTVKQVVSLTKHNITTTNIRSLDGNTYAIVSGEHALSVDNEGKLSANELLSHENGNMTGDEALVRWTFERNGTTGSYYYISTMIGDAKYYLSLNGSSLSLTDDQAQRTVFTATRTDTDLTLRSGSYYIRLSGTGVSVGSSAALSLYTIPTGSFTVNFDGQLGYPQYWDSSNRKYSGAENVVRTTDAEGYITLPTAAETKIPGNYPMRLNGWYDIINRVYYDSSMLGQRIRVTNNTIFYAEWIAATYDIGQNVDVVANQPDTRDFITTNVFDYNELFNMHSAVYSESSGTWSLDPDSELGFIFFDYLTSGNIANMNNKDVSIDGVTVNVEKTNGRRGSSTNFPGTITPGIANDARLEALFGETPVPGRIALGEADWLYSFDKETGYYYYNSAKNAASYNQSEQRFYVYDHVVNIDSQNSLNDFLPFNYGQMQYAEKDNEANYWFGMKSEINFYLPDDSGSGLNKAANGTDDMQFRFSGDDDVWIFIDGQLALDLGGVHDVVYGEINFSTGKVKTGQAISSSEVADNTAESYDGMPGVSGTVGITTGDLPMTLAGGKQHTITVYYLERGSSLSNCAIYFNLSPAYELEITKHDKQGMSLLEGAKFQIFDDEACTQASMLYIQREDGTLEEVPDAIFTTGEDGIVTCWGLLSGKTYYIKEIEAPDGYGDMSDHVIRVDLTEKGEAIYVVTDSNGELWEFASAYSYSDGTRHRIELDVYNDMHIGGDKKLYVEKVWAEGSKNIPGEITVRLYANDEATARSLVLSAENDWKGIFYELPETDTYGNEIIYSVKEEGIPPRYSVAYEEIEGSETIQIETPAHWESVAALEDGATYRFVSASTGWAVQGSNSTAVNPAIVSDSDDAQLWIARRSGSGFLLQNKAYTNRYLSIGTSTNGITTTTSTGSSNATIFFENGQLRSSGGGYLRDGTKTTINGSGSGYRGTRYASYAGTFTAYKWIEASVETESVKVPGWRITNTPWDETLSIPVEKHWDSTVSNADRQEISLELYLVTEGEQGSVEAKGTLTLNAENDWRGSFDGLPYPSDGSYYCVIENTDKYLVVYSGETVFVFADNMTREAARIVIDENGKSAKLDITNSVLVTLPDTGGVGTVSYTIGGLLLMTAAGSLLLYKYRKRRIG